MTTTTPTWRKYLMISKPTIDKSSDILNIVCCYNEMQYLPSVLDFYKREGIDVVVADNFSDDATWEWLNDQHIPCIRFDTNGEFNLFKLQAVRKELMRHFSEYDWVIYGDADEYLIGDVPLSELVEMAVSENKNSISFPCFEMMNTGEPRIGNPVGVYFSYERQGRRSRLYKNRKGIRFAGDSIRGDRPLIYDSSVLLNYGKTKTKKSRSETLERRQKAWTAGLPPVLGRHYAADAACNWTWNANNLKDIRKHKLFTTITEKVLKYVD
jgi:glycosyltransferase involved in cell wall biosynthesis